MFFSLDRTMTKNSILYNKCQPKFLLSFQPYLFSFRNETTAETLADIWCLVSSFLVIGLKMKRTYDMCYVHFIFHLWFLVTFGDKVMKIWKYYVIFVYILQGKLGKTKKRKESDKTKVTKIPETKSQKYGMNETMVCVLGFGF